MKKSILHIYALILHIHSFVDFSAKFRQKLHIISKIVVFLPRFWNKYAIMKKKTSRLDTIKMLVSSQEIGSQEELLKALWKEGFNLTQATLSRDLKQLKVAKATNSSGKYVYVLPNDIMYHRQTSEKKVGKMMMHSGFISLTFSKNLAVIRTRPGYASSIAYDIDNENYPGILGTIAGDDTILLIMAEDETRTSIRSFLKRVIPDA